MTYRRPYPLATAVAVAARTDLGRKRSHNEDTFLVADLHGARRDPPAFRGLVEHDAGVALAAIDGMGGCCGGEVAARVAAEALCAGLAARPLPEGAPAPWLRAAMSAANTAVVEAAASERRLTGIGAAATLAVIAGDVLHLAQLGDTRAYVLRAGTLTQVTRDDSLINDALALGIPPEKIAELPRLVITKALGVCAEVEASTSTVQLRAGDVVLLCSDGLHAELDDEAIARTLRDIGDPDEACLALVNQALHAGGNDNLAVIVARPEGDFLRPPGPGDTLASPQPKGLPRP